ncbi:MAG: pyrroline-5-carboxylate reductase [Methylococcaceae bacterium]|nr:pyrroline-5-carboxylate reductase [Methylococcaceae bacterium]
MDQKKIGFIGGGNMASALVGGLIDGGYPRENIWVSDIDSEKLDRLESQYGIRTTLDNRVIVHNADVLVLAVKPQVVKSVLTDLGAGVLRSESIVISIVAGIREADLQKWLGAPVALIRAMPNTPALIRSGATALHANSVVTDEQRDIAESILRSVGLVVWLESESRLDAVTALSGSGPAYFFLLMEAMEESALRLGLDRQTARLLIEQTAFGAAKIALEFEESPAELRVRVTSPGGTTQKALEAFEKGGFRTLVAEALSAAHGRSIEMSRELGGE